MRKVYLSIRSQLQIGFIVILVFVALLGFISWSQSKNIAEQAQKLYEHPFQVQAAAGKLKVDMLSIHRDMKEMMVTESDARRDVLITDMEINQADAFDQIAILQSQYLGPQKMWTW